MFLMIKNYKLKRLKNKCFRRISTFTVVNAFYKWDGHGHLFVYKITCSKYLLK